MVGPTMTTCADLRMHAVNDAYYWYYLRGLTIDR
jgi:hypothetical protein